MKARKKRAFPNRKQDMKSVFALLDFVQCHDNSKIWLSEAAFTHDEIQPDLYRPKRSFGQGNIFTSVCHSVHRGWGLVRGGGPPNFRWGLQFFWGGVPPNFPGGVSTGIRSMFGRYASYWNAFLFTLKYRSVIHFSIVSMVTG